MIELAANLEAVQARIVGAARRGGRDPGEVTLVVVTKTQPASLVREAYDLGVRHFGESRVEEAEGKIAELPGDIAWHMIGHIQSRKVKQVVPLFHVIHSVDRLKVAERLDRERAGAEPLPVLIECNTSGEHSKDGLAADRWESDHTQREALWSVVEAVLALPNLRLDGLMTMAPVVDDPEQARVTFCRLRALRDALSVDFPHSAWPHLSMGMTDDFEVAIEEGATLIRLGRAIFASDPPV